MHGSPYTLQKQSSCPFALLLVSYYSLTMLGMQETIPLHTMWRK